jgi:hypothetical protein
VPLSNFRGFIIRYTATFFLPVKVLAAMYKGKLMAGLKNLESTDKLLMPKSAAGLFWKTTGSVSSTGCIGQTGTST